MTHEDDALIPWQVRAWRRPAVRWTAAAVTAIALTAAMGSAVRDRAEREERRDALEDEAAKLSDALSAQAEFFEPLGTPGDGDWRAEHPEPEQTLVQYMSVGPNKPTAARSTIYLRAVGPWPDDSTQMDTLRDFAAAYFQVPVAIGAPLEAPSVSSRTNEHTGKLQWRSDELLYVLQRGLPEDAFCVLGVTHVDLWPGDGWNYVFGQASLRERTGIFSFARHDDAFFDLSRSPAAQRLRRDVKVMTHEIGHMFTMEHCQAYACNMNGTNSLSEADRQPLHLCPVCAQKLKHAVPYEPARRHAELLNLYARHGLSEEADWTRRRIASLSPK